MEWSGRQQGPLPKNKWGRCKTGPMGEGRREGGETSKDTEGGEGESRVGRRVRERRGETSNRCEGGTRRPRYKAQRR